MKTITLNLDAKSMIIGFLSAALLSISLGFNNAQADSSGKYQVSTSERGFIILDTQSGEYILDSSVGYIGRMQWIKGEFKDSYKDGINKTKK